ncbi:cilia- and flagella-associated protein 157-like [Seriola aureovittata]|uniref:cilia- and flagella-associated protein 157-like n=1 Tax=Seriola aureovittata TaxID=2871759 RepID=UPI0024BD9763|nr:cilia- and flagella-associated protein 157-like [Seriola aureovittata]
MPKKKDKKSSNKQDEAKKPQKSETPADKNVSDDKEKDLYLTQIRYLNEQLERYQLKCDELERQKRDFNSQYSALEKQKKDIVEYLKCSVLEKEDELEELSERLESQRQAADKDRDALQLQHSRLRQELQDRIEELTKENRTLVARLASLEEFQKEKEQLMSNMASLEKQVAIQKEEHKADIHNLEMKALLEKRRLEKEMESHVAAMEAEVKQLVDQKVPETTRLALQENTEARAQLNQLSEQTHILMKENSALLDRKTKLSVDVDILEHMLSELSRKSCIRKKVVEQLTEKCQQLQAELNVCRQELQQLQTEHRSVLVQMEALRQDWASLSEQSSKNKAEVSRLDSELQEERRKRSRMKSIMQEAAVTLRQALMEQDSDRDLSVVQWKQLVQKLLVVLDRPTLVNSNTEKLDELQTSDAAAASATTLGPSVSFQFQLARYRPGDLGLVPPPASKHKRILSRTRAASILPLHRKPSAQKTSSSVTPTDSAVSHLTSKLSVTKLK